MIETGFHFRRLAVFFFTLVFLSLLAGCSYPGSRPATVLSPTLDITQAYATVNARLTQAVALTPQVTPSPAPTQTSPAPATPALASSPPPAATTAAPAVQPSATPGCDIAAAGNPIDVTIPDDTQLGPAQEFTKTWRLANVGKCAWTKDYSVDFFSGEAMGALASIPLNTEVAPGQTVDVSVDMKAPSAAGTYQGNWKLRNAADDWFGIGPNGSAPFWVRIVVGAQATVTITATAQSTAAPTVTPAPVAASGTVTLLVDDQLDLDTVQVNAGGTDLTYSGAADTQHELVPQSGVQIGVFQGGQPSFANCQSASLASAPIKVEGLAQGSYLCFRTNGGLIGRAGIASFNPENAVLLLDVVTWTSQ